jgi:hypothetical protein
MNVAYNEDVQASDEEHFLKLVQNWKIVPKKKLDNVLQKEFLRWHRSLTSVKYRYNLIRNNGIDSRLDEVYCRTLFKSSNQHLKLEMPCIIVEPTSKDKQETTLKIHIHLDLARRDKFQVMEESAKSMTPYFHSNRNTTILDANGVKSVEIAGSNSNIVMTKNSSTGPSSSSSYVKDEDSTKTFSFYDEMDKSNGFDFGHQEMEEYFLEMRKEFM